MYVCICNAVTDRAIREAAESGARSFADVRSRTGCADCCGSCEDLAAQIFNEAVAKRTHARALDLPMFAVAA
jgi:bacterioferritin-associated ferredoxin